MADDDEGGWSGLVTAGSLLKSADVNNAQTRKDLKDYYELLQDQMESLDQENPPGWMTGDCLSGLNSMYESISEYASHFDVDPAHVLADAISIIGGLTSLLFGALKLTVSNTRQIVSDAAYSYRSSRKKYDDGSYSNGVKEGKQKGKRKDKSFEGSGKNAEKQERQSSNEIKYTRQERAEQIRRDKADIAKYEERRARRARLLSSIEEEEEKQQQSEMAMKR